MDKAVFFDRDGTINYRIVGSYVKSSEEFYFIPDFFQLFIFFKKKNYKAFVVTNQQGIGKGLMTDNDLALIHEMMQERVYKKAGCMFDDIVFSRDLKNTPGSMRKPDPAMLLEIAAKYSIDLSKSLMIGDSDTDIQAGRRAGTKTLLLGNSPEVTEKPDFHFANGQLALEFFTKNKLF